jgi:uncharacterized membrane protein YkoI
MKRVNLFTLILLATLVIAGTISASWAGSDEHELALVKSIIETSGITAQQSIQKVQQDYKGVIYSYELDDKDDVYYHEIKLIDIKGDQKIKLYISIQSGAVVIEEKSRLFSWFSEDKRIVTARKLATLEYSILDAINVIGIDHNSLLSEVELEDKQGVLFFELETIGANGEKKWLVDAHNNQIIPVFKK